MWEVDSIVSQKAKAKEAKAKGQKGTLPFLVMSISLRPPLRAIFQHPVCHDSKLLDKPLTATRQPLLNVSAQYP